jgi:uncharacterized protein DUF1592/uncharacterized protein DUF1588/uncharacterized protein DUF1595/uncharacterized protein DUF1585/uncharacterized protein DUF1587
MHGGTARVAGGVQRGARTLAAAAFLLLAPTSGCIMRTAPPALGSPTSPAVATQFARLTHRQWSNTVRDLFELSPRTGVDAGAAEPLALELRQDPRQGGFPFDNHAASLSVDEVLWRGYQHTAAELAERVSADPVLLARIAPPGADRARRFVTSFGARAHRRPLAADQVDAYLELFSAGRGAYAGLGEFESGARLVLEAMLQSPFFLYRVEGSGGADGGKRKLDAYELASRLSYTLWDSLPDARLFAQAASGALLEPGAVAREAERMLADERARGVVLAFHAQLFEADRLSQIAPSPRVYPDVSEQLAHSAERERNLFIEYQVLERDGGYKDLLGSSETFVDAELARVYGLSGSFGTEFAKVSLEPRERRGLLTQVAFLASNATSVDPDPIHRGVFIARRVLCKELSAPPNLPPLPAAGGRTNRQTVEAHTEQTGTSCSACHKSTINPLGFPFETYDAVGRMRTSDNGLPVDSSSLAPIDGAKLPVKDGVELAGALANSAQAHTCYARRWLEYAYGRPSTARDRALIERLGQASRDGLSVKRLLIELVSAPAFALTEEADLR